MAGSADDLGGTHACEASLTPREKEVLALVGRGLRCREIAARLCIAVFTVRKHRSNILGKLGLHSTAKLVAHAVNSLLVSEGAPATLSSLSQRERQVMALVGIGLTSKEIARRLNICPATVRKHRENVSARLGIRGMAQMIRCVDMLQSDETSCVSTDYVMGVIYPNELGSQHGTTVA
jgi:DNA-binding CsgD family transcriptional regulator